MRSRLRPARQGSCGSTGPVPSDISAPAALQGGRLGSLTSFFRFDEERSHRPWLDRLPLIAEGHSLCGSGCTTPVANSSAWCSVAVVTCGGHGCSFSKPGSVGVGCWWLLPHVEPRLRLDSWQQRSPGSLFSWLVVFAFTASPSSFRYTRPRSARRAVDETVVNIGRRKGGGETRSVLDELALG